jgi:glutamine synthetase
MKYAPLTKMADNVMYYKYVVRNVTRKHGKTATFMPKPIFGDNGSGMHTHQSLWKGETNLFWDEKGYAQISQMAKYDARFGVRLDATLSLFAPNLGN